MSDIGKVNGLNQKFDLNTTQNKVADEKLKEVADMYEQHFMREMIKQMKSAQLGDGNSFIKKNHAEKIFQEQLDDQYSKEWNQKGGFGLSEMIYDQLQQKFNPQNNRAMNEPHMPIDLKPESKVMPLPTSEGTSFKIENKVEGQEGANLQKVKNPWAGTLQMKNINEMNQTAYRIKHDNGLESLISIQGGSGEGSRHLSVGDHLAAGSEIGFADTTSPLFWTVRSSELKNKG